MSSETTRFEVTLSTQSVITDTTEIIPSTNFVNLWKANLNKKKSNLILKKISYIILQRFVLDKKRKDLRMLRSSELVL